ncbi:MAG: GTPase Era [Vicinamibacterales bacterium]
MMKSGVVSFLGRPNAGKSTLLNRIVGHKLAIVSDKPQTTRTRILGVKNYPDAQVVFVDTPGVHKPTHRLNVRMVDAAIDVVSEVDVLILVVDASVKPGPGDKFVLDAISKVTVPVILVLTKVDLIAKARLLPLIDHYQKARAFAEIVPLSAVDGTNVDVLERLVLERLPEGAPMYPPDYVTDMTELFAISEIVREQVLQSTHDELPFSTAVLVDRSEETPTMTSIHCTIVVDRESQKPIVVGKGGSMIKRIGTAARLELERYLDAKVFLDLHVKVRSNWRDDERALDELGVRR